MSAYEQKIEPPDRRWQYVLFAAEPYETIGFKVPSREVDKSEGKFWTLWNKDSKQFFIQFAFKVEASPKPPNTAVNQNIAPPKPLSNLTSTTVTNQDVDQSSPEPVAVK
jgi:hypothetical protein